MINEYDMSIVWTRDFLQTFNGFLDEKGTEELKGEILTQMGLQNMNESEMTPVIVDFIALGFVAGRALGHAENDLSVINVPMSPEEISSYISYLKEKS